MRRFITWILAVLGREEAIAEFVPRQPTELEARAIRRAISEIRKLQ